MPWSSQQPSAYPLNGVGILASNFYMNFPGFTLCAKPCDELFSTVAMSSEKLPGGDHTKVSDSRRDGSNQPAINCPLL